MVDLETLATTIDANVLTIGAIKFDPHADYRGWNWLEYPETQIFTLTDPLFQYWIENGRRYFELVDKQLDAVKANFPEDERYPRASFKDFNFALSCKYIYPQGAY